MRMSGRQDFLQQKVFDALRAAETRRHALLEAEKERLSAAHELVLTRMVSEPCALEPRAGTVQRTLQRDGRLGSEKSSCMGTF